LNKTPIPPSPKKKLGQNFLCDQNMLLKIVEFIQPNPSDVMLEIGAGTGALTALVAPQVSRFIAVELDQNLLSYLESIPNTEILHQDIRQIDLCATQADRLIQHFDVADLPSGLHSGYDSDVSRGSRPKDPCPSFGFRLRIFKRCSSVLLRNPSRIQNSQELFHSKTGY
jgi:hypothetical protein